MNFSEFPAWDYFTILKLDILIGCCIYSKKSQFFSKNIQLFSVIFHFENKFFRVFPAWEWILQIEVGNFNWIKLFSIVIVPCKLGMRLIKTVFFDLLTDFEENHFSFLREALPSRACPKSVVKTEESGPHRPWRHGPRRDS